MRSLPPAPSLLVDPEGQLAFGAYSGFAPPFTPPAPLPFLRRMTKEKRWVYVGVVSPSLFFGAAVVGLRYAANAFGYVALRGSGAGARTEVAETTPFEAGARVEPGSASFRGLRVRATARWDRAGMAFELRSKALEARLFATLSDVTPASVLSPSPGAPGFVLTRKWMGAPVEGTVRAGDRTLELDASEASLLLDDWWGFPPRETRWNWAAAAGRAPDGSHIGLNLVTGVNDAPGASENAVWIRGTPHPVGPVEFQAAPPGGAWRIRSRAGGLALTFTPEGERARRESYGVVSSEFRQPYGTFTGVIERENGSPLALRSVPGVCEDHFARW